MSDSPRQKGLNTSNVGKSSPARGYCSVICYILFYFVIFEKMLQKWMFTLVGPLKGTAVI